MVRWAVARGDLDHFPIDGMKGPPVSKPRTRVLTDDEIRTIWIGLRPDVARVVRLCLVTCQRIGEVTGLTPSELDLVRGVWNIPGRAHQERPSLFVPLSELALEIIGDGKSVVGSTAVSHVIRRHQFGLPRWTAHDLRRTALTKMAELGVAPIVLGHIANHRTTTRAGVTLGVYVQHQYEREKWTALELWADRLQGIEVVPVV